MNGVKLEHMCHYSVNLSLHRDRLLVISSMPLFTGHSSQAANILLTVICEYQIFFVCVAHIHIVKWHE